MNKFIYDIKNKIIKIFRRFKMAFEGLSSKLQDTLKKLKGKGKLIRKRY